MYYKYRSLDNFKNFADIILNNRLYAASYENLNDPMEGQFKYSTKLLTKEVLDAIRGEKEKQFICSLSKKSNIDLMWSHYCDGHKGVVIELTIKDKKTYDVRDVKYEGLPEIIKQLDKEKDHIEVLAKEILTYKHDYWNYEEEVRVLVKENEYVEIDINKVILGTKISQRDEDLIRKFVGRVNPNIDIKEQSNSNIRR